jgi:hypothetical protein
MMAIAVINQPTGLKATCSTLVATNVPVSEVNTKRYHIFGLVYSKYVRSWLLAEIAF